MRDLRARECILALSEFGFRVQGETPIRIMLTRGSRRVFVPRHGPLSDGELEAIVTASGVERADFERACFAYAERATSMVQELATKRTRAKEAPFARILERFGWRDAG